MHRYALLLTSILILCYQGTAQTKVHDDSVKEFLRDWIDYNKDFRNGRVSDNSLSDRLDTSFQKEVANNIDKKNRLKVYKTVLHSNLKNTINFHTRYNIDSIILSKKEINIVVTAINYKSNWVNDYFSSNQIFDKTDDSLFYFNLNKIHERRQRNLNLQSTDSFKVMKNYLENGFWILSKPIFLKNNCFAVIFSRHIFSNIGGGVFAHLDLTVYKKKNNYWHYFGDIFRSDVN